MEAYELAFRMQMAAPELLDFSKESKATLEMYSVDKEPDPPLRDPIACWRAVSWSAASDA